MTNPVRALAIRLERLERNQRAAASTAQLGNSSFGAGAVQQYGPDGQLVQIIGDQPDGTHTQTSVNGPIPPAPSKPHVVSSSGIASVSWDGQFVGGAVAPLDLARIDVYLIEDAGDDPLLTPPVASILSQGWGDLKLPLTAGDYYVVFASWTQSGKYALSQLSDPILVSPSSTSDGVPPAASPACILDNFAVGGLRANLTPILDTDATTKYRLYASLTSPVTTSDFVVGTTSGTSLTFNGIDGVKLSTEYPVYAAWLAYDADGDAVAGLGIEGTNTPRKADIDELNVDQLNANIIETWSLIAASIQTDIALVSGKIIVGDKTGSHIEIDPAVGLTLFGSMGTDVITRLDMTDAQLSEFTGKINASQLSVMNGLELQSLLSKIMNNARLTIIDVVGSPDDSVPTMSYSANSRPWLAVPVGYIETGIWWDGTLWWQLCYNAGLNRSIVRKINSAGVQSGATITLYNGTFAGDNLFSKSRGIVKIGSTLYSMRYVPTEEWWVITSYSSTDGSTSFSGHLAAIGSTTLQPTLGYDGTNLLVASLDYDLRLFDTPGLECGVALYNPSTYSLNDWYTITAPGDVLSDNGARYVGIGIHDYASSRVVVAGASKVLAFTTSGHSLVPDTDFPQWSLDSSSAAVGWDGDNFFSVNNTNIATRYSNFMTTDPDDRRFFAAFSWEDGADETTLSAKAWIDVPDRRWLNVGVPNPGPGTTSTRIYLHQSYAYPSNSVMEYQASTSGNSAQFETVLPSGIYPNTVSDFLSGTPGEIRSANDVFHVDGKGDGWWYGMSQPHARRKLSVARVLADSTITKVLGFSSVGEDDTRIAYSAGDWTVSEAGVYLMAGVAAYDVNSSGLRTLYIYIDGVAEQSVNFRPDSSGPLRAPINLTMRLAPGAVVSFMAYQSSGGNLNLTTDYTRFSITRQSA